MQSIQRLFDFQNKIAVVTGGAMGIGYGIVQRLHEAGAHVVIADIDETIGKTKAEQLNTDKARCLFVQTDVSDEQSVLNLFTIIEKEFGQLDIFVNNAGIFPTVSLQEMTVDFWDTVQNVNGRGVFLCTREAINMMKERKSGSIINIGSIDSLHPSMVGLAAYDASKHAVWGFTKNVALECGALGIRVNAIAPGGIATEGVQKMSEPGTQSAEQMQKNMELFLAKIPMGRMGQPDDIATAVVFLASDAASYMTGSLMVIDGGALLS